MNSKLKIDVENKSVTYEITDFEEPISKSTLREWKKIIGGNYTLNTNAGVELHSTEIKYGKWNGITIKRLTTKNI